VVYEGVDLQTNATVALKVMSIKDGRASMPIKGVRREIEYAAAVQHDNIVKLLDFVADERNIVIVWELIDGSDLLDLLNEQGGRLDEATAAFYFAQLLRAVTFIHAHGLCHRDLKPENCMVERATNRLKIIDFGLSKHQQSAVTLGVGTPDYMAPELLGGTSGGFPALKERRVGQYDARACDVWAMGVLLYLLVTGQYPFEDPSQPHNVVATLQNISMGRVRPLSHRISSEFRTLIEAMLTQDPRKRITLHGIGEHPWLVKFGVHVCHSESSVGHEQITGMIDGAGNSNMEAAAPRVETFSFPSPTAVPAKSTPVTPRMIHMNASAAVAAATLEASPTVSPPQRQQSPTRSSAVQDRVVHFVEEASEHRGRSKLSGLCRMWFTGKGLEC
jgi:serine/threonine protein kinase